MGHAHDEESLTGCTVFIPTQGNVASCEVRGGAPGTRETELLRPSFTVAGVDAVLFAGGSAFGLNAASGVVRYLEEQGVGFPTPAGKVPIVSAAIIFDMDLGSPGKPDADMAYKACVNAKVDEEGEGIVGVGYGASVGNVAGRQYSTKSGFGIYRFQSGEFRLDVAAVPNAFGDVVGEDGEIIAGARAKDGSFICAEKALCEMALGGGCAGACTTLVLIATNARLTREQAYRVATQGHNGIARAIRPSHTRYDGDTVFVISTCEIDVSVDVVETLSAIGTAGAIRSGVLHSKSAGGLPCASDLFS
ncbi:MAG: P1 family peptidase [Actinomycetota bacterium]|nr:P1 family peptidase [Actinomycetota bacterium]